jgi:hypothetical protein
MIFELDLFGDGHAIVGDGRGTELLVDRPLRPRGRAWLDRIGNVSTPRLSARRASSLNINLLWHILKIPPQN